MENRKMSRLPSEAKYRWTRTGNIIRAMNIQQRKLLINERGPQWFSKVVLLERIGPIWLDPAQSSILPQ